MSANAIDKKINYKEWSSRSLEAAGTFLLNGQVDHKTLDPIMRGMLQHNIDRDVERMRFIVCSNGGLVTPCFALIDIIKGSKIPIDTVGVGMIASCGLLLFLAGKERILTPNTAILSHQFSAGSSGKHHELMADIEHFSLLDIKMVKYYMKMTGLSKVQVEKELLPPSDVWLTAKKAKKLNIATKIVTTY